ncbi:trafficking kinesin-binding protein milt isoform X2 [Neodiprion lecontei]|uniref:Trafficking kinesin-binding protein milt isoform X2 n=1 Tax=Neodiprion lecontei TaxID=441921 RepID=A0ABM3G506_NEOLC|nr:trafficking kinesin-binding protein milt isoform X2 [Neodiprion fabricii]XP_046595340.1 trafficking kinesin-binding protein milt isoform X2 [Neodiprion lecontei]
MTTTNPGSSFSLRRGKTTVPENHDSRNYGPGSKSVSSLGTTFNSLALDVSYAALSSRSSPRHSARSLSSVWEVPEPDEVVEREDPELWEDIGVVEYLERRLGPPDESTADERVEDLRQVLIETDLHEGDGEASDFLFHVARTKHGKIYIRVIRTLLMNRVLCSNRVSQMTKTYNDIEAVTRLLEEKEKDLELTARIGKELLTHNQKLESNVTSLETELKLANEKITQLSHELIKKTELVQILTNDVDDSGSESGTPTGLKGINLDMMQRRISVLEDENKQLRTEFTNLVHDADDCEEKEARLVKDIAAQLASANMEADGMADELDRQKEENRLQHEQIVSLRAKLAETELRLARLLAEHDEMGATLVITKDNQNILANELAEFKDRYTEVVNLLAETQEQLRKQRKKGMPMVRGGSLFPSLGAAPQPDSIASELESSLYSEASLDSGIISDRTPAYKKVFETVRSASRASYAGSMDANQFPRIGSMTTSTLSSGSSGPRMSCGALRPVASSGFPSLDSTGHSDSEGSLLTDSEEYPGPQQTGVPGAPGAADLEAALRRLTPAEVIARRACLSTGAGYNYDYDAGIQSPPSFLPFGCRTPDSIMSTGSSGNLSGFSGNSGNGWRLPEKLQIVKPIEGSQTLHHWTQLATPTLGGLLDERPGVKTRGGRALEDLGLETFTLADLEEDEEYANPGKLFQDTGSIYTFTNSTVLHPDDHTSVTASVVGSRVATAPNSALNSGMNTPRTMSRRNSTSTFSTTLGLAKMLNERGIKAVTPSCVSTPSGERNFTPTATPCNSPDGTPPPSRSSSPPPYSSPFRLGLFSSGAELLKRTFGTEEQVPVRKSKRSKPTLSRSDKKALTGIRLVEKLERIGIDTIMATTASSSISPLALQGAIYTRRSMDSPMAQLTSLKTSMSSSISQDKLSSSSSSSSGDSLIEKPPLPPGKNRGRESELGVPARPGSGALTNRLGQLTSRQRRSGAGATRPDLGKVKATSTPQNVKESAPQSALGTISSLLFGRKGGLL